MSSVNTVLELLADGNWHNLTEISKNLRMPFEELDGIVHFLNKYGFVEISDDLLKVKLEKSFNELVIGEFEEPMEKPKTPMLMTIKGNFNTINSSETEIVVNGMNLEIESMHKEKPQEPEKPSEMVSVGDVISTMRFLVDNEWHRYDEITGKLQFSTEKLLQLIKVLRENDLVIVHDKFGMLRLRQELKIKQ